jgi:hypothetical protein
VRGQEIARELIGAGTDRLDITKLLRRRDKVVIPEAGDHEHVGVADPGVEICPVPDLKALDPRAPTLEQTLKLIGDMGEADGQVGLGRNHGWGSIGAK